MQKICGVWLRKQRAWVVESNWHHKNIQMKADRTSASMKCLSLGDFMDTGRLNKCSYVSILSWPFLRLAFVQLLVLVLVITKSETLMHRRKHIKPTSGLSWDWFVLWWPIRGLWNRWTLYRMTISNGSCLRMSIMGHQKAWESTSHSAGTLLMRIFTKNIL